jgi:hydroxymethylbilane synthase
MGILRIGIRKSHISQLAAEGIRDQLVAAHSGLEVEILPYESSVHFTSRDPEIYIQELEKALMDEEVDLVVHLLKEIPVHLPAEIRLVGVSERITPFDAFVSEQHFLLDDLPEGATVGVSHLRQKNQLLLYRYDLEPVEIHGSVDSRLQQMRSQSLDGLLISAESLERVGLQSLANEIVSEEYVLPSPGQGCLGFLGRREDADAAELVRVLEDHTSRQEAIAERAFLDRLGGNPEIAIGVHAALDSHSMIVEGVLISADAGSYIRDAIQGPPDVAELLGGKLAELLLALGDEELHKLVIKLH